MTLDAAAVLLLASQCAPSVAPQTMLAIVRAESALNPLAVGVNGGRSAPRPARSRAEAVGQAKALIAGGRDIDLGLGQINVRNLPRLGLTVEGAFDPCRNLAAASEVLSEGYRRAAGRVGPGQAALRVALSYYNTGHTGRGFRNGYVARVVGRAMTPPRPETPPAEARPSAVSAQAPPPAWDVFARAEASQAGAFVFGAAP